MKAKEKALELCNKFMICNSYQGIVWHNARLCALIAVDEMLNCETNVMVIQNQRKHFDYWERVKEEIELL